MVFDGIIVGLFVGLIRGGFRHGLQQFSKIRLKGGWVFPVLLLIQFVIFRFQEDYPALAAASNYAFIGIYVVGMIFLWMNRNQKGFSLILIGVFLNFLVMAVNGGRMPVSIQAASVLDPYYVDMLKNGTVITKHFLLDSTTKLYFLGDIIPLSPPYPRSQAISIGDIVMNIGIFLFIVHIMTPGKNNAGLSGDSGKKAPTLGEPQNL
ncbi:DUF5317 domain-containing protein [Paenibacillus sp. DMB20]|uniref:DUF5317 domain-containing protein n=1 Tax=Paenibacillus sp. DMB20 TaxID=1642570 RepID=UPI0006274A3C|nr:DUF5317 domain-containing protein [Paenibacillus sp. DMB20]KKO55222.1 membrane protein [Paenibacillus sp. DMB20]